MTDRLDLYGLRLDASSRRVYAGTAWRRLSAQPFEALRVLVLVGMDEPVTAAALRARLSWWEPALPVIGSYSARGIMSAQSLRTSIWRVRRALLGIAARVWIETVMRDETVGRGARTYGFVLREMQ